ncbi:MAG: hypothetical protein F6K04_17255 [Leptolyngbya sp. SIO4C5]|uniref:hypothetical protein n=1 Tax=Sphaerothrix gracilis TaxID=3151835 RepID=UPI0013C013ED|nr:hypothetical protein [Leptolyngbya sp. SIO4C5]
MQNFNPHPAQPLILKPFLAGGLMFAIVGLFFDFQGVRTLFSAAKTDTAQQCETVVQAQAKLSRETLAQLLTIPERDPKAKVRELVAEPYCQLPELQVRSGVVAEREAYPLAFDPQTRLVILYENDEYAGYRFDFQ